MGEPRKSGRRLVADVEFHLRNAERAAAEALGKVHEPAQRQGLQQVHAATVKVKTYTAKLRAGL